ncbi:response regulator transcription factor [Arthrobacter sp. M4]|uniref:response regulator n=1 Tax=Arthrobacter sp. M4 TaxID=218160 RepID=UPI001CDD67ED|nr:response regulator transcription factor [Arthrobacter sp. M4]MCA4131603.1 response regulator transcription factor [Arthrobacter sp. M4]
MITVLLVDDQPAIRVGLRAILESAGFRVGTEAGNGREALLLAQEIRPEVVLMDLRMPGTDGTAGVRLIRAQPELEDTKIIVLTTFDDDPDVLEALRAGADGFLSKSAGPEEIIDAVRKASQGDITLSQRAQKALLRHLSTGSGTVPTAQDAALAAALTARERDIVIAAAEGLDNEAIARAFFISPLTVKTHINRAMAKLNARDRGQLVAAAYRIGLMSKN